MTKVLRKWWVWPIIILLGLAILFTILPGGSTTTDQPLRTFTEEAKAGRIRSVKVNGREIEYKLIGDDQTFAAEMEENDTVREVLQDAGIEPEEFPPIEIRETPFWSRIPGLLFAFLPIIFFVAVLYFAVRAAVGGSGGKTRDNDPVCGKRVGAGDAAGSSTFADVGYRFCSAECKQMFDANPVRYLLKS